MSRPSEQLTRWRKRREWVIESLLFLSAVSSILITLGIVLGTQLLYTASDLLARWSLAGKVLALSSFLTPWFLAYFLVRQVAMVGQLYVFSQVELGRTAALFGAASIIIANALGFLLLHETLSLPQYAGVSVALIAILLLAVRA